MAKLAQKNLNLVPVRNVIRWISKLGVTDEQKGVHSVDAVEDHLAGLYELGYELLDTHYLGDNREEATYGIFYVLVRKQPTAESE